MAYIWENYSEDKRFRTGERISPYLEIAFPDSAGADVNPLLRFARIFEELAELRRYSGGTVPREDISDISRDTENLLFHYLAQMDLLAGLDARQIRVNALEREILTGSFGSFCAAHWQALTRHDRRVILYTLAQRYESVTIGGCFFEAAQKLWEYVSILYEPSTELYYLYIYARKTDYSAMLLEMITLLFWDIQCSLRVFWYYHYGIIGAEDSMRISEIQIV